MPLSRFSVERHCFTWCWSVLSDISPFLCYCHFNHESSSNHLFCCSLDRNADFGYRAHSNQNNSHFNYKTDSSYFINRHFSSYCVQRGSPTWKANSCTAIKVSLEESLKCQKEKRALKLTSTIIAAVAVSYTTPWIITVIARLLFAKEIIDVLMAVGEVGLLPLLLNSVINPIIYTEKKKTAVWNCRHRAVVRKSFQEAQAFDGRLFGSKASGIVKTTDKKREDKWKR